ncbi:MAG: DPP IV N-terminal domain-containing protein [Gemmatimonadales bacterium]
MLALRSIAPVVLLALAGRPAFGQVLPKDSIYQRLLDFPSLVKGGRVVPRWAADGRSLGYRDDAGGHWRVELPSGKATRVEAPAEPTRPADPSEAVSPNGDRVAFLKGWNVWTRPRAGGAGSAVTTDGAPGDGWTANPFYTRPVPLFWSPDGRLVMAIRADHRNLNRTTVVEWRQQEAEQVVQVAYPLPGGPVEQARVCLLIVADGSRVCLDTGPEPDQVLYPVGWSPDGSEAFVLRFDRFMKRLDLLGGDPRTGSTRVLVRDSQPTFIEGVGFIRESVWFPLGDGRRFIWRSERDGWSHLYLHDREAGLLGRITGGDFRVDRVVGVDERVGAVFFLARAEPGRPYDVHFYRTGLDGRGRRRLTEGTGEHDVFLSPDRAYFVDIHSDIDRPPRSDLRRAADGALIKTLAQADIGALTAVGWRAPETFVVKAADGVTDLYGAIYLPTDFDPAKRYPVVDNQYMGNIRQAVPHRFVGSYPGDESYALAERGFVVFLVDGRGTIGRSKAFHDATYGRIGTFEVADHIATLRQLAATRPFMDTARVGITGFSWGGYYTLRALLTASEVFKVGVSGAPVVDLLGRANRVEPYMGTPQSNPAGYANASNVLLAGRLQAKLMLAIGTSDSNVTFTHAMRMADALIKAGKHFDMVVLPGETHLLSPAGQRYYAEARARFFVEHLKP